MLCGDLLFSGHTLIMVVASLTIEYYLPASLKFLHYIPKLITMIGVMCLVLSRTHYTIDVIFAYWLSVGVFSIYHAFCEIDIYRERKNSILNRLWLVRFIGWLEINVVPGKLDNIIEVPLIPRIYKKMVRSDDPEKPATSVSFLRQLIKR
jgi:shingomyelin synthase